MVTVPVGVWQRIHIERSDQSARMTINDEEEIRGNSKGSLTGLNLRTHLYLGGVSDKITVAPGVGVKSGFDGCISNV